MEYLGKYSASFKHDLSPEQKHELAMIKMIASKLKSKYNVKSNKDLANALGVSPGYLSGRLSGKVKIDKGFISLLCFHTGITKEQLVNETQLVILDEYFNSKGQLMVDGVNYGKIT